MIHLHTFTSRSSSDCAVWLTGHGFSYNSPFVWLDVSGTRAFLKFEGEEWCAWFAR